MLSCYVISHPLFFSVLTAQSLPSQGGLAQLSAGRTGQTTTLTPQQLVQLNPAQQQQLQQHLAMQQKQLQQQQIQLQQLTPQPGMAAQQQQASSKSRNRKRTGSTQKWTPVNV